VDFAIAAHTSIDLHAAAPGWQISSLDQRKGESEERWAAASLGKLDPEDVARSGSWRLLAKAIGNCADCGGLVL